MSFHVLPPSAPNADVISLDSRRPCREPVPELPAGAWDDMEAAAETWERLRDEGREVRFDLRDGRVVSRLHDRHLHVVQELPLARVIGAAGDEPPSAA